MGTVTPRPQPGNEKPRVFRLKKDQALINWMGFPSSGAEAVAERLTLQKERGDWPAIPVGFNLGKNKDTAAEDAAAQVWPGRLDVASTSSLASGRASPSRREIAIAQPGEAWAAGPVGGEVRAMGSPPMILPG